MSLGSSDSVVASQLADWFTDVVRLWRSAYFDWSTSPRHRDAAILETLSRNAKFVIEGQLDDEYRLYKPLSLALAAACTQLDAVPTSKNWLAALRNVQEVRSRLSSLRSEELALPLGTPASLFRDLFSEALVHAGVTDRPTALVEENRRASLGLAVNWGLRFLIAYALECHPPRSRRRNVRDLAWVRSLITSLSYQAESAPDANTS